MHNYALQSLHVSREATDHRDTCYKKNLSRDKSPRNFDVIMSLDFSVLECSYNHFLIIKSLYKNMF